MKVSIVVPCYNEESRIKPFLTSLIQFSKANLKNYEIVLSMTVQRIRLWMF